MPLPLLPIVGLGMLALLAAGSGGKAAPVEPAKPKPQPAPPVTIDGFADRNVPSNVWDWQRGLIAASQSDAPQLGKLAQLFLALGTPGPALGALFVAWKTMAPKGTDAEIAANAMAGLAAMALPLSPPAQRGPQDAQGRAFILNQLAAYADGQATQNRAIELDRTGQPDWARVYMNRAALISYATAAQQKGQPFSAELAAEVQRIGPLALQQARNLAATPFDRARQEILALRFDPEDRTLLGLVAGQDVAAMQAAAHAQAKQGHLTNARILWRMSYLLSTRDPLRAVQMAESEVARYAAAKPTVDPTVPGVPTDVAAFIAQVRTSTDPQQLSAAIAYLRSKGFVDEAAKLEPLLAAALAKAGPVDPRPIQGLEPNMPPELAARVAAALAREGDPAKLLALSAECRASKFSKAADELEAKAVAIARAASVADLVKEIERQIALAKGTTGGGTQPSGGGVSPGWPSGGGTQPSGGVSPGWPSGGGSPAPTQPNPLITELERLTQLAKGAASGGASPTMIAELERQLAAAKASAGTVPGAEVLIAEIERQIALAKAGASGGGGGSPGGGGVSPGGGGVSSVERESAQLAQDIALDLLTLHPYRKGTHGKENKASVKRFQQLQNIAKPDGSFDGLAGAATVLRLAKYVSNVPPVLYWGRNDTSTAVIKHRAQLNQLANAVEAQGGPLAAERAAFLRLSAAREKGQGGVPGYVPAITTPIPLVRPGGVTESLIPSQAYLDRLVPVPLPVGV